MSPLPRFPAVQDSCNQPNYGLAQKLANRQQITQTSSICPQKAGYMLHPGYTCNTGWHPLAQRHSPQCRAIDAFQPAVMLKILSIQCWKHAVMQGFVQTFCSALGLKLQCCTQLAQCSLVTNIKDPNRSLCHCLRPVTWDTLWICRKADSWACIDAHNKPVSC